jgi:hypothetical protein
VEPEIADELPRRRNLRTSPIRATSVVAVTTSLRGIVFSRRTSSVAEDLLRDDSIDLRELVAEEVQLTPTAVDGQALIDRQNLLGIHNRPFTSNGSEVGLPALEVAVQHRADVVLIYVWHLTSPRQRRHEPAQHPLAVITDPRPRDQVRG